MCIMERSMVKCLGNPKWVGGVIIKNVSQTFSLMEPCVCVCAACMHIISSTSVLPNTLG